MITKSSKVETLATQLLQELRQCPADIERLKILKNILSMNLNAALIIQPLTPQENHCLLAAAHGKTSSETAILLGIKASTVETHRKSIKQKLGCSTIAQAVFIGLCCKGKNNLNV
jgi:DNA-binding CsgD family transcriptional regulator